MRKEVALVVSFFLLWVLPAIASQSRKDTPPTPIPESAIESPIIVYTAGTLTLHNKKTEWFTVVEPNFNRIAALVVTAESPNFDYSNIDETEIPFGYERLEPNGAHATYFIFASNTCTVEQLASGSCNYRSFICDVATKLDHVPELSMVNIDQYVSSSDDKTFWCGQ